MCVSWLIGLVFLVRWSERSRWPKDGRCGIFTLHFFVFILFLQCCSWKILFICREEKLVISNIWCISTHWPAGHTMTWCSIQSFHGSWQTLILRYKHLCQLIIPCNKWSFLVISATAKKCRDSHCSTVNSTFTFCWCISTSFVFFLLINLSLNLPQLVKDVELFRRNWTSTIQRHSETYPNQWGLRQMTDWSSTRKDLKTGRILMVSQRPLLKICELCWLCKLFKHVFVSSQARLLHIITALITPLQWSWLHIWSEWSRSHKSSSGFRFVLHCSSHTAPPAPLNAQAV